MSQQQKNFSKAFILGFASSALWVAGVTSISAEANSTPWNTENTLRDLRIAFPDQLLNSTFNNRKIALQGLGSDGEKCYVLPSFVTEDSSRSDAQVLAGSLQIQPWAGGWYRAEFLLEANPVFSIQDLSDDGNVVSLSVEGERNTELPALKFKSNLWFSYQFDSFLGQVIPAAVRIRTEYTKEALESGTPTVSMPSYVIRPDGMLEWISPRDEKWENGKHIDDYTCGQLRWVAIRSRTL
jgi:hypothetical protein